VAAATIGGVLIDAYGFGAVGVFCLLVGWASAAIVFAFVREELVDLETQPA
jgi:predicted MFS family arabinose efflux permease